MHHSPSFLSFACVWWTRILRYPPVYIVLTCWNACLLRESVEVQESLVASASQWFIVWRAVLPTPSSPADSATDLIGRSLAPLLHNQRPPLFTVAFHYCLINSLSLISRTIIPFSPHFFFVRFRSLQKLPFSFMPVPKYRLPSIRLQIDIIFPWFCYSSTVCLNSHKLMA